MQFDPNVINREDVQKGMIAQLEMKQVRLVILSKAVNIFSTVTFDADMPTT